MAAHAAFAFNSEAGNPILDRFNFNIGTFFYGSGTTMTLNGTINGGAIQGTPINLEHELGFQDVNRFRVDAYWRFTAHQRLKFMYFQADRSAFRSLDRTIQYGNVTYPINASISAENKVWIGEFIYQYDFLVREHFSLGANIGIHNLSFGLRLTGTTTNGSNNQSFTASQNASADGPLPLIGMSGIWRPSPKFYFTLLAQALKVTVNPYSGSLQNYGMTAVWQPFEHFGVGGGYDYFKLSASVDKTNFNGNLSWRYSGPRIFFNASF
jgi:hypothetical protein